MTSRHNILCVRLGEQTSGTSTNTATPTESRARSLAEACLRLSPKIALREDPPHAVFLDMRGIRFQEEALLLKIRALAGRFGFTVQTSFANDAGRAHLLVSQARQFPLAPLEFLIDYSSPFRNDPIESKKIRKMIEVIRQLGVRTLGQFTQIPTQTLASRFGEFAVLLSQRLARSLDFDAAPSNARPVPKKDEIPWPLFRAPEKIEEHLALASAEDLAPCLSLESLLAVAREGLDRLAARLRARSLRVASLVLEMEFENSSLLDVRERTRTFKLDFPTPQGSVAGIIPILRDRLSAELQRRTLIAPVMNLRLEAAETAPGNSAQKDFFSRHAEQSEQWDALMARIGSKIGVSGAFIASSEDRHFPEKTWRPLTGREATYTEAPLLSAREPHPMDFIPLRERRSHPRSSRGGPIRPTRLLKIPETLECDAILTIPAWLFQPETRRRWKITRWQGPERISGEWWLSPELQNTERDYYRLETESGDRLWVYLTPQNGTNRQLFLHGYFD